MGPFIGRLGTAVGFLWKGRAVARAYVKEIRYPNTVRQQAERDWFVAMVRMAAAARPALLLGMRHTAADAQMTEGNRFVYRNKRCFSTQGGRVEVDYHNLVIAEGPAAQVYFSGASVYSDNILTVSYESLATQTRARGSDEVYVWVYNAAERRGFLAAPARRRDRQISLALPSGWQASDLHLYGFTLDRDGRPSLSAYIPIVQPEASEDDAPQNDTVHAPYDSNQNNDITDAPLAGFDLPPT